MTTDGSFVLRLIGVAVLLLVVGDREGVADEPAEQHADRRVETTPDFEQTQANLPRNGSAYCAPVSASNGLVWLAKHGYPRLVPGDQLSLFKVLGSAYFMNTDDEDGTGTNGVMSGLAKYVMSRGYEVERLAYQGWRPVDQRFERIDGHANAVQVVNGLQDNSIVLLNVGWYKRQGSWYQRVGGHWVTLVGVVKGENSCLVIHDPSGRSRRGDHERVTVGLIRSGKLTGSKRGLPVTAMGAWELGGELKTNRSSGANTAVLDGAVLLQLK
jgi:hypothetical protein